MEPITAIATAIALGAAAGLQGTAEQAVRDAYTGLKALIQRRYAAVDLTQLEKAPSSDARQAVLREELAEAGADKDEEVLRGVRALMEIVSARHPEAAEAIGIKVEDVSEISGQIIHSSASAQGISVVHTGKGNVRIGSKHSIPDREYNKYVDEFGITREAFLRFVEEINRRGDPPAEYDAALREMARRYGELNHELDRVSAGRPAGSRHLKTAAAQALRAGDLGTAALLIDRLKCDGEGSGSEDQEEG